MSAFSIISGMILTKCPQYIILIEDCPGKQVQILYELVAVRHRQQPQLPVHSHEAMGQAAMPACTFDVGIRKLRQSHRLLA